MPTTAARALLGSTSSCRHSVSLRRNGDDDRAMVSPGYGSRRIGRRLLLPVLLLVMIGVTGCGSGSSASNGAPPRTWHLASLGDSIPVGGDDCGGCKTYSDLFGAWVQKRTGHHVVVE